MVGLVLAGFMGRVCASEARGVTLAWDPVQDANIAGYRIYYGGESRGYTNVVEVGNTNVATLDGLAAGVTYYLAATVFNQMGLESDLSTELTYQVPPAEVSVKLGNLTQVYDGSPKVASVSTTPAGVAVNLRYSGATNSPSAAGSYEVVATAADPNYAGSATATLIIAAADEALVIEWPATTNAVTLYQSADLANWAVVTNANNAMVILKEPGAHYFRAVCQAPSGLAGLPLSIRRP